jgi:hypothetical protein
MSKNLGTSKTDRRQFLAVAGSAVVASSLAVGKDSGASSSDSFPSTPVTYHVTIDTTTPDISYRVGNPPQDASSLWVKAGDGVAWQAKTTGSTPKNSGALLFVTRTPLVDVSGKPVYFLPWSQTGEVGGTISKTASGCYKYYVAVLDEATGTPYTDDPKIIVGKPLQNTRERLIEAECDLSEAKARIEAVQKELGVLIDTLNSGCR